MLVSLIELPIWTIYKMHDCSKHSYGFMLTGSIPASWSQLNLTVLDISSNNLNGTIDKLGYTGVWHYLEYFNASYNKLTGIVMWCGRDIKLQHEVFGGHCGLQHDANPTLGISCL